MKETFYQLRMAALVSLAIRFVLVSTDFYIRENRCTIAPAFLLLFPRRLP